MSSELTALEKEMVHLLKETGLEEKGVICLMLLLQDDEKEMLNLRNSILEDNLNPIEVMDWIGEYLKRTSLGNEEDEEDEEDEADEEDEEDEEDKED